jgi:2,5-diamino-6-(ribosylamino)-4(3H)-pyrimidinone 5'-phosphate reductase
MQYVSQTTLTFITNEINYPSMAEGNKPHVIINCAMSVDGKIALPTRVQTRISNPEDMRRVYELRNRSDAILVGINTIINDNPKLTVKEDYVTSPSNPLRVVLDSKCRVPEDALVLDGKAPTIIAVLKDHYREVPGADVIAFEADNEGMIDIPALLGTLDSKGIKTLLVEGGETVIWSFLKNNLADGLYVFVGSIIIGGTSSPTLAGGAGVNDFQDLISLKLNDVERLGDGVLLHYKL